MRRQRSTKGTYVVAALEACFPLVKMRRKSTDPPWINAAVRRKFAQQRGIYRREGRSKKWKRLKKITEDIIKKKGGASTS